MSRRRGRGRPVRSRRAVLAALSLAALGVGGGDAAARQARPEPRPPGVERIAAVKADEDLDRVPDRLGAAVRIQGTVTTDTYRSGEGEFRAYLQDESAGIRLVAQDAGALAGLMRGDRIRVSGYVGHYRATETLEVSSIERLGEGSPPEPRAATVADVLGEELGGQLVRIRGRLAIGSDLELIDETGSVNLYLRRLFFADPRFADELSEGRPIEAVGIAEQYDAQPPFTGGYRLLPRDRADLVFDRRMPWAWILGGSAVALLALSGLAGWTVVTQQRAAVWASALAERTSLVARQRAFLATAGHEIRTPLTVLRGDIEVALLRERSAEEYRKILQRTLRDVKGVATLADDLIILARTDEGDALGERSTVEVAALVDEIKSRFQAAAEAVGGSIEVALEPELRVHADPGALRRALANVVDNAVKYGGHAGPITIEAHGGVAGHVEIRVADRGPGIEEAERARIFDRFYRGSRRRADVSGAGLGLPIARAIMERHGGGLEVRPHAGGGSVFMLWCPHQPGAAQG